MNTRVKQTATRKVGTTRNTKRPAARALSPAQKVPDARAARHRTAPGFALRDLDDAASFLEQMGLLLQTRHPYLPSLFGAAQGQPAKPGARGFGQWPEHAWSWAGELAEREDVVLTKIVSSKRTLVHERLWPVLDAAVRGSTPEGRDAQAIVSVLEREGAARTDELRELADLDGGDGRKRYEKAMGQLESLGIVLCRPILVDNHKHVALAQLWSSRFPKALSTARGIQGFVRAAIEAAGPVPAREVPKWFAWPRSDVATAIDELSSKGKLRTVEGLLVCSGA